MSLAFVQKIITALTILKSIVARFDTYRRNRHLKKEYRRGQKHVRRGEIDEINDILRGLIPFIVIVWMF